jgi:transmembrane sensor
MSGAEPPPPKQDQLLQEAAGWFARMRGDEAEASRGEFEAWLRRGALHRQAYNRAAEIFAMGKMLADEDTKQAADVSQVTQIMPHTPDLNRRHSGARTLTAVLGAVLVLVAVALLALRDLPLGDRPRPQVADAASEPPQTSRNLATQAGETRTLRLADGSMVGLEGSTLLEVHLEAAERRLVLVRGRAHFDVAHERRPFVVHAGGGRIMALGTRFEVAFSSDQRVTVRLVSGAVDVTLPMSAGSEEARTPTRRLQPGDTISYGAAATGQNPESATRLQNRVAAPRPDTPTLMRDYDAIPVADLIAAANRGSTRPIRLADPAIGTRRVSGRFSVDNSLVLAERLGLLFDLEVDRESEGEILLRAR